eukprot:scaffold447_cov307-Pinguiococcus_pyrenoidosus.AAC.37
MANFGPWRGARSCFRAYFAPEVVKEALVDAVSAGAGHACRGSERRERRERRGFSQRSAGALSSSCCATPTLGGAVRLGDSCAQT